MLLPGDRGLSLLNYNDVLFSQTFANPGIGAFQGHQEDSIYPSLTQMLILAGGV